MATTRTSKADFNYLSCSNGIWGIDEGSDHAKPAVAPPLFNAVIVPDLPSVYAAILKICDRTDSLALQGPNIAQGQENAIDINNRAAQIFILDGVFGGMDEVGDQVITVKGGSRIIRITGVIRSKGRNADVVVGAWSDQCHDASMGLDFTGLFRLDGKPVTFILSRCWNVKLPKGAKVLRLKSLAYSIYWWGKFAALKLGLLRQVGP